MPARFRIHSLKPLSLLAIVLLGTVAAGQDSTALLTLQRSRSYLNLETNVVHAQGMTGITYGKSGDVFSYPNTLSCLVVYGNGKFVVEKRDEQTLGKPKIKLAEGDLSADDFAHLKQILDDENLKKISTPKPLNTPDNATIREIESVDAQINRGGTPQHFTTTKERLKMRASETSGASNGMDTYLDNGAPIQKTLNPLLKWFEGLEKKSKSDFKDAKPQYCVPMNIG
jgi:hypothetical protein